MFEPDQAGIGRDVVLVGRAPRWTWLSLAPTPIPAWKKPRRLALGTSQTSQALHPSVRSSPIATRSLLPPARLTNVRTITHVFDVFTEDEDALDYEEGCRWRPDGNQHPGLDCGRDPVSAGIPSSGTVHAPSPLALRQTRLNKLTIMQRVSSSHLVDVKSNRFCRLLWILEVHCRYDSNGCGHLCGGCRSSGCVDEEAPS
jgi:hypothetical protein